MSNSSSIPEIILIAALTPLLLGVLIALFNFDWLNEAIMQFHNWIVKNHSNTKSKVVKFILAFFKYPGEIPQGINHDGWRSGFTFIATAFSTVIFGGTITIIGIVVYYIVMATIAIALAIVAIIVVLAILGAILGAFN